MEDHCSRWPNNTSASVFGLRPLPAEQLNVSSTSTLSLRLVLQSRLWHKYWKIPFIYNMPHVPQASGRLMADLRIYGLVDLYIIFYFIIHPEPLTQAIFLLTVHPIIKLDWRKFMVQLAGNQHPQPLCNKSRCNQKCIGALLCQQAGTEIWQIAIANE